MKAIVLMFDSLRRDALGPYAGARAPGVRTPHFERLARRAATFDASYVCSMPCMPARRDFHTGRPNFLHNAWGPLEPFDDSVPAMLDAAGVHAHLATDHYHYFEDGGATYHGRYTTWQGFRGQEGDPWLGRVGPVDVPPHANRRGGRQDWVNRAAQRGEADMPQSMTVAAGLDFVDANAGHDGWLVQVECFDPHEPFVAADRFAAMHPPPGGGDDVLFDWPPYGPVTESPDLVAQARRRYAALVSQCDDSLGRVLDAMDRHELWRDTMLVVWTDHGYLLGEHGAWAKNWVPMYEEVARTPLFVHDPRSPGAAGSRRGALVQPALDLGPTLLRLFGLEPTEFMTGRDLAGTVADDTPVRDAAVFGQFGDRVNLATGRHAYLRAPANDGPCHRHTLMPTSMRGFAPEACLRAATLGPPLPFTRGMPVLRVPRRPPGDGGDFAAAASLLFDLAADPRQERPLDDPALAARLDRRLAELMRDAHAPPEQFARLGLDAST